MLIQEFCRASGLTRDTVRFYVKHGLLRPTIGAPASRQPAGRHTTEPPSNRYQVFDATQVQRARLIRAAQSLGFTLREIAALATVYDAGGMTASRKAAVLRRHLAGLDARAVQLDRVRTYLAAKLEYVESGEVGPAPRFDG
jgi:MerR family copper efflux transcriptional regulator